jgi:hypothetical protein
MSIMLFPSEPEKQKDWIEQSQFWDFKRRSDNGEAASNLVDDMGVGYWLRTRDFPSKKQVDRAADKRAEEGTVAGDVLRHMYLMSLCEIPEPSLRKASFIIRKRKRKYKHREKRIKYTEQQINQIWTKYRPVAHLWAALRMNDRYRFVDDVFADRESFFLFLTIAKTLQEFARTHTTKWARGPLISSDQIIHISADVLEGSPGFQPDADFYNKILKKYTAATR